MPWARFLENICVVVRIIVPSPEADNGLRVLMPCCKQIKQPSFCDYQIIVCNQDVPIHGKQASLEAYRDP